MDNVSNNTFFKKESNIWVMYFAVVCFFSLFITQSFGKISDFPWVIALLFPRFISLLLVVLPVQTVKYSRSATLTLTGFWLLWVASSYGFILNGVISLIAFVIFGVSFYFVYDKKGNYSVSEDKAKVLKDLSIFAFISLGIIIFFEIVQCHSLITPMENILSSPDLLACNLLFFTAIGSFIIWVRKPKLFICIYMLFWLILAGICLFKSLTTYEPVLLLDVFSVPDAIPAAVNILGIFGTILVCFGIALLIFGIVLVGIKEKTVAFNRRRFFISMIYMVLAFVTVILASNLDYIKYKTNLPKEAYAKNGFVYSFITYGMDSFVTEPKDYSDEAVHDIIANVENTYSSSKDSEAAVKNIIVIQVESFVDPTLIEGSYYERDPIPYIHSLMENYSTGYVDVPVFGGQTIKSEFEFLSGMDLGYLPFGYSPYVQTVFENPIDSLPRYLKSIGFEVSGIHDYQGEFFKRNEVYKNLGFERFISYEFMAGVEKKDGYIWADDEILLDTMKQIINKSDSDKHFIFNVSVQTHGKYPIYMEDEYTMELSGIGRDAAEGRMAYYVSQLEHVDDVIKSICEYFESLDEPTFILFYGDHLPTFYLDIEGYDDSTRFSTQYFTWNNIGLKKQEDKHIELFELSTELFDTLGMDGMFMNRFQRLYKDSDDYEKAYEIIQYYKLFEESNDKDFSNDGFTMGLYNLQITEIKYDEENDYYVIKGTGFTEDAYLNVNGRVYDLDFIDSKTMHLTHYKNKISEDDTVTMRIIGGKYGGVLKESEAYDWS